jgi:protein-S-isoprenylcysteine O-methyltransferase Ste14
MNDSSGHRGNHDGEARPGALMRLWLAAPDWVFRAIGAGFFLTYLAARLLEYRHGFWESATWYKFGGGLTLYVPYRVLVDVTYLLIAVGFLIRAKPQARAARGREILLPLIAAFWPFLPFAVESVWLLAAPDSAKLYSASMFRPSEWSPWRFLCGSALVVAGNLLEIWGYAALLRSLSIVAEARHLKTAGPYRLVRHPIYLGQFLAQGGIWLFYAHTHAAWILFYLLFVAMQLWRSRVEDQVLEQTFGEEYLAWKRRTFWFF